MGYGMVYGIWHGDKESANKVEEVTRNGLARCMSIRDKERTNKMYGNKKLGVG